MIFRALGNGGRGCGTRRGLLIPARGGLGLGLSRATRGQRWAGEFLIPLRGREGVIKPWHFSPLNRLAEHFFDTADNRRVVGGDEGEGIPGFGGAACAPDAVRVGVYRVGDVVVDDVGDAGDINPAGGDVGGDEDVMVAFAESVQGGLAFGLGEIPLQGRGEESGFVQLFGDAFGAMFGAGKNEDRFGVCLFEEFHQEGRFEMLADGVQRVGYGLCWGDAIHLHGDGVGEGVVGEVAHFFWHGGGEEERLALGGQVFEDAAHIRQKSHIKHHVGLVKDEDLQVVEADVALVDVVEQTSGAGDDNVHARAEFFDLRGDAHAAVNGHAPGLGVFAQHADAVVNLFGEFARGGDDQGADLAIACVRVGVIEEVFQDRQDERGGFAGASLREAHHVTPLLDGWDGLQLDGGRGGVPLVFDSRVHTRGEVERFEVH